MVNVCIEDFFFTNSNSDSVSILSNAQRLISLASHGTRRFHFTGRIASRHCDLRKEPVTGDRLKMSHLCYTLLPLIFLPF